MCGNGSPVRPLVSLGQLWGLAQAWYSSRLLLQFRRPDAKEMREIFSRLGLTDAFWDPEALVIEPPK